MESLQKFIRDHDDLVVNDEDKVLCISTKHEFGSITDQNIESLKNAIESYFGGKKYKMSKIYSQVAVDDYPYIVPHKKHQKKVYCMLCSLELNKVQNQIESHIKGRKHAYRVREQESLKEKGDDLSEIVDPENIPIDDNDGDESMRSDDSEEVDDNVEEDNIMFEVVPQSEMVIEDQIEGDYSSGEELEPITAESFLGKRSTRPQRPAPKKKNKRLN